MATTEEVAARITRTGLEGDGVASRLFELLWKRDLLSDSSLALRIPDTVIFKYNAPSLWYFTSVDGTIKRKGKAKVNNEYIAKEFLKRPSLSGIAAYYVTTLPDVSPGTSGVASDGLVGTRTTVEYLDRQGLQDFLFDRQRVRSDGILQRFIEPKAGHNNMVRALWSPKVCLLERRVNHLRLNDNRYDIYERTVTFEGADCHSEVTPVRGPALVTKVHEIADSIVQHVAAVTGDRLKISRLALNFKVDDRDRLWLLFASSVRLRDELARGARGGVGEPPPLEAGTVLQVPEHVRRARSTSHACPMALQRTHQCPTCCELVEAGCLFDVCYRILVEYEERARAARRQALAAPGAPGEGQAAPECEDDALEVPEVLRRLHPRLTAEEYSRYRNDLAFLYKAASVCESCFLRFSRPQLGVASMAPVGRATQPSHGRRTGFAQEGDADAILMEAPLLGVQKLEPGRLRLRRHATLQKIHDRQVEEEEWREAQMQEEAKERRLRAKSCPRLPSWNRAPTGATLQPPVPVLANQPRPPQGAAPLWSAVQSLRQPDFTAEPPPPRRSRRVPPLRGEPYLREVQAFAARYAGRAAEVLGPAAYEVAVKAVSIFQPSAAMSSPRPRDTEQERCDLDEVPQRPKQAVAEEPARDHAATAHHASPGLQLETTEDSDGPDDVLDESEGDPIVAELWGKWPPSCDSRGGARSGTPTTRPPSQGDPALSGLSSRPGSRPSTRTSSRGKSPAAVSAQQLAALQHLRIARPRSSPQVGHEVKGTHPEHSQRPSSSPNINHGFRRTLSLGASGGNQALQRPEPR